VTHGDVLLGCGNSTAIRRSADDFSARPQWMMAFQCKDGGWRRLTKIARKLLEKVPFADHNACRSRMRRHHARILELLAMKIGTGIIRKSAGS